MRAKNLQSKLCVKIYNNNNKKKKKKKKKKRKIYNVHIVMNHELEAAGQSMLLVNELGYEVRLEVALETVWGGTIFNKSRN